MRNTLALIATLAASPVLATGLDIQIAGEANGTVHIDLYEDLAPNHVKQITTLAERGVYDGVWFHRVMEGFMAQTGDVEFAHANGDARRMGTGGSDLPDLKAEFSDRPYDRGIVGMARAGHPDSANSQFFIMFQNNYSLNGQYTVVGEVTSGMEVVDQIKRGRGRSGLVAGEPDRMVKVTVTD